MTLVLSSNLPAWTTTHGWDHLGTSNVEKVYPDFPYTALTHQSRSGEIRNRIDNSQSLPIRRFYDDFNSPLSYPSANECPPAGPSSHSNSYLHSVASSQFGFPIDATQANGAPAVASRNCQDASDGHTSFQVASQNLVSSSDASNFPTLDADQPSMVLSFPERSHQDYVRDDNLWRYSKHSTVRSSVSSDSTQSCPQNFTLEQSSHNWSNCVFASPDKDAYSLVEVPDPDKDLLTYDPSDNLVDALVGATVNKMARDTDAESIFDPLSTESCPMDVDELFTAIENTTVASDASLHFDLTRNSGHSSAENILGPVDNTSCTDSCNDFPNTVEDNDFCEKITSDGISNMERRKEKSRDAARCRRSKEHEIFTDLCNTLPLSKADGVSHLDKASIVRIAIAYLKMRSFINSMSLPTDEKQSSQDSEEDDSLFLNALEGFLIVSTKDGDIVYISENVSRYLGLSQVDILGQSLYDLSHPCEHAELKDMLSTKENSSSRQRSHFLRMKCTLTSKGRNVNIKSASYKLIRFGGRMMEIDSKLLPNEIKQEKTDENEASSKDSNSSDESNENPVHFVAVGEPISHPANIEIPLGLNTFLSKHSLDMKFTYVDEKVQEFFGYDPKSLEKKSFFNFYHAEDSASVMDSFKNLIAKGQARTDCYRFLAHGGGYAWVITEATVIYNSTNQPTSIVTVNFVISEIECPDEVYSLCQVADECEEAKGSECGAGQPLAQQRDRDSLKRDVADGYPVEKSPQRLIEKLTIGTSQPSPPDDLSTFPLLLQPSAAAAATADRNADYFSSNRPKAAPPPVVVDPNPAPHAPTPICLSDFFCDSVPADSPASSRTATGSTGSSLASLGSPSTSATSSALSSPSYPVLVDAGWQINAPYDPSSLPSRIVYPLPVASSDRCPREQQRARPPDGSPSSLELAETDAAHNRDHSGDSWQVTAGSANAEDSNADKTLFDARPPVAETPKPSTINVFVPFTEDMKKGFLAFADDDTELTMLKEDPEDLTHLAPTAGDVCVPLDETPIDIVLPDMLDDIILSDPNLLSSGANARVSPQPLSSASSSSPDSFFSCKDELEPSSRPHSPILTQNENGSLSPYGQDDDSPLHMNSVNDFLDFGIMNSTDEMDVLSGKSSLLPLTLEPEPLFPLVTSNDFMWGSSSSDDSCAWSSVSNSPNSNSSPPSSSSSPSSLSPRLDRNSSSLAKLLTSDTNYDGGGGGKGSLAENRVGTKRTANGQVNRRYQNGNIAVKAEEKGRQRSSTLGTNSARWTKRTVPYAKSRSAAEYYGDVRKYRLNLDGGLQNTVNNMAREATRLEDRRKKQGGGYNGDQMVVGFNRSFGQTWSRGGGGGADLDVSATVGNECKRSKQASGARSQGLGSTSASKMNGGGEGRRVRGGVPDSGCAATDEVAGLATVNSVLMNLLLRGCDPNAGYTEDDFGMDRLDCEVPPKKKICGLLDAESTRIPSLMDLTEQDYAVNAPPSGEILQGSDLLRALESPGVLNLR